MHDLRTALALFVFLAGPATALDPQTPQPYRWMILLRTPKHPMFDQPYRQALAKEIQALLQPGLGLAGTVEVWDLATDPHDGLARQFALRGWEAWEVTAKLPLDGNKYHGLNIELHDRVFVLTARQWDGFAGQTTPMLRTQTVRMREQISRAAGLLLEPDFCPHGTVELLPDDTAHAMLTVPGNDLLGTEARIKPGDLFAVSVVREQPQAQGKQLVATAVPFTFLRAVHALEHGRCKCAILTKWTSPFGREVRRAAGVRAIRLPTITAPLRIRLVNRDGKRHDRGTQLTITATDVDFQTRPGPQEGFEWRDGEFRSLRPFTGIACVRIGLGADRPQLYPVPILGDQPVTLVFDVDPEAERRAVFLRECTDLRARITELSAAQEAMLKGISMLLDQSRNREALERAERGHEALAQGSKQLQEELLALQQAAPAGDQGGAEVLAACANRLTAIARGQERLLERISELKEALAKANDPANLETDFRRRELAKRITDLLARGDVPEALAAYDLLIELAPGQQNLKDEREKLRREWTPKDEAHRAARDCIRMLGTARDAAELRAAIQAIKQSLPVFKARKDKLGLRKLKISFEPAIAKVNELLRAVDGNNPTEQLLQTTKELEEILTELEQCNTLVRLTLKEVGETLED